jgi:predicted DNA-binding protein with PD1-like motif
VCPMLNTIFRSVVSRAVPFTLAQLMLIASVAGTSGAVSPQTHYAKKKPAAESKRELDRAVKSQRLLMLPFRLRPGQDLRQQIEAFVKAHNIRAGFILTAVGSLRSATIRLADQKDPTTFAGKWEIVSLVGTMGQDGVHLHISIADSTGKTVGGHLVDGCLVYTTVEIVVGEARGLTFAREQDGETGYKELKIRTGRD